MSRYRTYGQLDESPVMDGDKGFIGVDERDPTQIAQGYVSEAVNYSFRDLVARPRKGIVPLAWLNGDGLTWPWNFPVSFEYPRPITEAVLAGAVFDDADDLEWIIIAGNPTGTGPTQVFALRQGFRPKAVKLPTDMPRLTECSFTQCFNVLIMFRGTKYPALVLEDVRTGFKDIAQTANAVTGTGTSNPSDGTEPIPQAVSGVFLQNRLFIPFARDLVAASDFLNYTRYSATREAFRINQGSADGLVALYKFGEQSLIAFKEHSVYLVNNLTGDLSGLQLQEITREYGLTARRAVVGTGADVWFLSARGITSIGQALENKVQLQHTIWSDSIPVSFGRINWLYKDGITAAYFNGFLLWAVPLDDGTGISAEVNYTGVNNAVLVYDTQNKAWAGVWQAENLMVRDWLQFSWLGKRRLGYVGADGMVYVTDFAFDDQARATARRTGVIVPVSTRLVSRGYDGNGENLAGRSQVQRGEMVRWQRSTVIMSTWDPSYTLSVRVDGANESATLAADETRDRRKWVKPFSKADYGIENDGDNHADEWREDYSVDMSLGTADGALTPAKAGPCYMGGLGVNLEQHQEAPVTQRMNAQGRLCQIVVENARGRVEVKAIAVDGRAGRRRNGVAV